MRACISIITIIFFSLHLLAPVPSQQGPDNNKILLEGREAYNNGEYEKAIAKLSVAVRVITAKDDLTDAWIYLALAHFAIGDNGNSLNGIKNALRIKADIQLDTDEFSPKFIDLLEEFRKNNVVEVVFNLSAAAALYINGFFYKQGQTIRAQVVRSARP